jgi:hypothetical protein
MNKQILEFRKTHHFLFSQWDRKIDDQLLYKILPYIECTNCEKDIVFALPSFLKKKEISKDENQCLILVIKNKLLITAYWCKDPNYLFNKNEYPHYQLLY